MVPYMFFSINNAISNPATKRKTLRAILVFPLSFSLSPILHTHTQLYSLETLSHSLSEMPSSLPTSTLTALILGPISSLSELITLPLTHVQIPNPFNTVGQMSLTCASHSPRKKINAYVINVTISLSFIFNISLYTIFCLKYNLHTDVTYI